MRTQKDLEEVPEPARKEITFHFVDTIDEVLAPALEPREEAT
ncbi:MAG TPA: S16 family serine protease [Candidatus Kryptonia bacterium]|nr:S16 family serine protease [Candidatus Kryptonia bacterium]